MLNIVWNEEEDKLSNVSLRIRQVGVHSSVRVRVVEPFNITNCRISVDVPHRPAPTKKKSEQFCFPFSHFLFFLFFFLHLLVLLLLLVVVVVVFIRVWRCVLCVYTLR